MRMETVLFNAIRNIFRPTEVDILLGNANKAKNFLKVKLK